MKKVLWIFLLIVILIVMVLGIVFSRKQEDKNNAVDTSFGKSNIENEEETTTSNINTTSTNITNVNITSTNEANTTNTNTISLAITDNSSKDYKRTQLSDGILYSKDGKEVKPDVIINEKVFDTTINDMWLNPETYKGKKIQIEGMYLENLPYTFVGRYSTSNVCPNCPAGYSYFEYQLDGEIDEQFTDETEWIKVIGTFEVGNDASTNYEDFYYLKVLSLEVMNEAGNKTVNN